MRNALFLVNPVRAVISARVSKGPSPRKVFRMSQVSLTTSIVYFTKGLPHLILRNELVSGWAILLNSGSTAANSSKPRQFHVSPESTAPGQCFARQRHHNARSLQSPERSGLVPPPSPSLPRELSQPP